LFALGNGMLSVRACAPEATADDHHYPGTYRAGCYDRLADIVRGERVENESLVNLPNWLPLSFRIEGEVDWFTIDRVTLLAYRHTLHMAQGASTRELLLRDERGRRIRLCEKRLVSMSNPHLAALQWRLTPENWSGAIEIRSGIDGAVVNANVERFRFYDNRHLEILEVGTREEALFLRSRTRQSSIEIAVAAVTRVNTAASRAVECSEKTGSQRLRCEVRAGRPLQIEKMAAIHTSRDVPICEPGKAALETLQAAPPFPDLLRDHIASWRPLWSDHSIDADDEILSRANRFHMLRILQAISPHSVALDVGFPARGWQEAYHGHVFWDELLVMPVLSVRTPELAHALLSYRCRLDEAKRTARHCGYRGAMFPWRSASTGREETPVFQLNPLSGRWMHDHTNLQRHVGAAIAWNIWQYYLATGDIEFLKDAGAEVLMEIARFWASIAEFNSALGRFEIRGVVGPDEYHTARPGASVPGLNNNAYTNVMAAWTLCRGLECLDHVPEPRRSELREQLRIEDAELAKWDDISRRMRIVFHDGVISQFEGFEKLCQLDIGKISDRGSGQRIDWVLDARGDSVDAYQIVKQADTLMLLYLLRERGLTEIFHRLGYRLTRDDLRRTADYYLARTVHDSSLSRIVWAGALAQIDPAKSWHLYRESLRPELNPANKPSSREGVHLGAMAATIDVLQRCYLGLCFERHGIRLDPAPPCGLRLVRLPFQYRGDEFEAESDGCRLSIRARPANRTSVNIMHADRKLSLAPGGVLEFAARNASQNALVPSALHCM
jgi:trehalose/maltose hydrolase-like predicted phosphorylase